MAATPSHRSSRSTASSRSGGRNSLLNPSDGRDPAADSLDEGDEVPVEVLVEHLLAAKRSLSSMTLVLRANELTTIARAAHEETVVLGAQAEYLRRSITEQAALLMRMRRSLQRAYEFGKRDFKQLVKRMDSSDQQLQAMMEMLRATQVEAIFRTNEAEPKSLLDFLDEKSVQKLVDALKQSLEELQVSHPELLTVSNFLSNTRLCQSTQLSFQDDLSRFDTDLKQLKTSITSSPIGPSPSASSAYAPMPELLASLVDHSHAMAQLLTSLTKHFDLCVTAVRATDGGADLARRKAAEVTTHGAPEGQGPQGSNSVSISGVIAEQESHVSGLDPVTARDRADMVRVVVEDAAEVEEVVREIAERLAAMEAEAAAVDEQAAQARAAHAGVAAAYRALEDAGARVAGYVAAEAEFLQRWEDERRDVFARVDEMDDLRRFYEKYSSAYGSLVLEVERRRGVDERIQAVWRKARESVERLVEADRREREVFTQDAGDYLPTDLWEGMNRPLQRWEVTLVADEPAE